jgi:hypothetical protein
MQKLVLLTYRVYKIALSLTYIINLGCYPSEDYRENKGESPVFPELVRETAKHFKIEKVCAWSYFHP